MTSPKWQSIFWGVLLSLLALSLLHSGGLASLQTMTLITALPFGIIMALLCYNLWKALVVDSEYSDKKYSHGSLNWNNNNWKEHLEKIVTVSKKKDIHKFLNGTVKKAFEELLAELAKNNIEATIHSFSSPQQAVEIEIKYDQLRNFKYGVMAQVQTVSETFIKEENTPNVDVETVFLPITYFGDHRMGYDIQYLTKDGIISDVLREYERFLNLSSEGDHDLIMKPNS